MKPKDLLDAHTEKEMLEIIVHNSAITLLIKWRASGLPDVDLYKEKLVKAGWKYSRREGRWLHPADPALPAPGNLEDLAMLAVLHSFKGIFEEEQVHEQD